MDSKVTRLQSARNSSAALLMTLLCLSHVLITMSRYLNSVVSKLHNLLILTQKKNA
jgi:hypothetical protein